MLKGVFGKGELRHVANWQSRKYTRTWQEEDEGSNVRHTREYFSHECALLWTNGQTQILTHEPPHYEDAVGSDDAAEFARPSSTGQSKPNVVVVPPPNGGHQ